MVPLDLSTHELSVRARHSFALSAPFKLKTYFSTNEVIHLCAHSRVVLAKIMDDQEIVEAAVIVMHSLIIKKEKNRKHRRWWQTQIFRNRYNLLQQLSVWGGLWSVQKLYKNDQARLWIFTKFNNTKNYEQKIQILE